MTRRHCSFFVASPVSQLIACSQDFVVTTIPACQSDDALSQMFEAC
jgi:hypothetical protein